MAPSPKSRVAIVVAALAASLAAEPSGIAGDVVSAKPSIRSLDFFARTRGAGAGPRRSRVHDSRAGYRGWRWRKAKRLRSNLTFKQAKAAFRRVIAARRRSQPDERGGAPSTWVDLPSGPVDLANYKSTPAEREGFFEHLGSASDGWIARSGAQRAIAANPSLSAIPIEDLMGVYAFTTDSQWAGYRGLNSALRSGDREQLERRERIIRVAASGLRQLPRYRGIVFRTNTFKLNRIAEYRVGEIVTERGFLSTSRTRKGVENFSGYLSKNYRRDQVIFVIQSANGRSLGELSHHRRESEVLFVPGTQFEVIAKTVDATRKRAVVFLVEVPGRERPQ